MDDFEKAILLTFNQFGVDPGLKAQASAYLDQIQSTPGCWQLLLDRFLSCGFLEVRFWCLQALLSFVRSPHYDALSPDQADLLRSAVLRAVCEGCTDPAAPLDNFLKNKLAQLFGALVQRDYPRTWPDPFLRIAEAASTRGPLAVDMHCRVLTALDEDVISLEVPRTQDESKKSMHVKDALRDNDMAAIAALWLDLTLRYHADQPALAALVLETARRYICWMDINLIANDRFAPLLFALVSGAATRDLPLRAAAVACLCEVASKRMDPGAKVRLVQRLQLVQFVEPWAHAPFPLEAPAAASPDESEFSLRCAQLVSALAAELLDCWKRAENGVLSLRAVGLQVTEAAMQEAQELVELSLQLLSPVIPTAVRALGGEGEGVQSHAAEALQDYVAKLRRLGPENLGAVQCGHLVMMLQRIARKAQYPAAVDQDVDEQGQGSPAPSLLMAPVESEQVVEDGPLASFAERRQELFTLFRSIAKLIPADTVAFVGSLLRTALQGGATSPHPSPSGATGRDHPHNNGLPNHDGGEGGGSVLTWREVEVAVSMVYQMGENLTDEALKGATLGPLEEMARALVQFTVPHSRNPLVALAVLECMVRYARGYGSDRALLSGVLGTFLDDRGIGHASTTVSTRACYLFMRLVKALKGRLDALVPSALAAVEPHLSRIASTPLEPLRAAAPPLGRAPPQANASGIDDRLYCFEAVGHLLGSDALSPSDQSRLLTSLLGPLVAQVKGNLGGCMPGAGHPLQQAACERRVQQALVAVAHVSKGFSLGLMAERTELVRPFLTAVEAAIEVVKVLYPNRPLRARVISFIHRMVECLASAVLPHLPPLLVVLLGDAAECPDVCETLQLLVQLAGRFKEDLGPLFTEAVPSIVSRVHAQLVDWDWTGRSYLPQGASGRHAQAALADLTATQRHLGAASESIRERNDVQRAYYAFLLAATQNGLAPALARTDPAALDLILGALLRGAGAHVDQTVRKTCLQALERLVEAWLPAPSDAAPHSPEAFPGFRAFAAERVGWEVCVLGLVRGGLDPRDAATTSLVMEVSAALILLFGRCGGEAFAVQLGRRMREELGAGEGAVAAVLEPMARGDARVLRQGLKALFPAPQ